jgi:Putative Flp pilus-assembly TadE/G-like
MSGRRPFIKDTRGSVGILFGLTALAAFLAASAALDYGRAVTIRTTMQAATDAAAAAAAASPPGSDTVAVATNVFRSNYTASPAPQLDVAVSGNRVTVTAATTIQTSLMAMGGVDEFGLSTRAEAEGSASPVCILLLETTGIALDLSSGAALDAGDCGVHINSTNDTEALSVTSNSSITAADVCVVGNSNLKSGGTVTPPPTHGCAAKADPMATLPKPPEALDPCWKNDFVVNNNQTETLWPNKMYCGTTEIKGNAIMPPGLYVFRGGEFVIKSGGTVTGTEVTMFFADKDARLNANSNSTLRVTAPKTGTYQGVLMFQLPDPDTQSAPVHVVHSNGGTELEGTIYLPNGVLELNSNSTANVPADYTLIIARRLVLKSNGSLQVESNYSGNTPKPPLLAGLSTAPAIRLVR